MTATAKMVSSWPKGEENQLPFWSLHPNQCLTHSSWYHNPAQIDGVLFADALPLHPVDIAVDAQGQAAAFQTCWDFLISSQFFFQG